MAAEQEAGHANEEDDSRLISASERGDVRAVERLLERGAGVDSRDEGGRTALIAAAYGNRLDVAGLLVDAGADVNAKDETQQSAYLISTSEVGDDPRLLELTLRNGANVHSLDGYNGTGLIRAAERGHVRVVERLLRTDIEVNHVNNLGWTALLEAIILGDGGRSHTEVVRLLVRAGANVNLADGEGVTPMEHARRRGYEEIVRILQSAGAR
ncbi:MAG TPA: ankyrin repeat domain-containing protein [Rubrobacteraceae bacterium]|nr:ankyrin repeat domain-containing protein [Rubrobacteraceae bacterium]